MSRSPVRIEAAAAVALTAAGLFSFITLLMVAFAGQAEFIPAVEAVLLPARFLFGGFLHAAFFVPAYLLILAYLSLRWNRAVVMGLTLSLLPFLTVSLALKVALGDMLGDAELSSLLRGAMGKEAGVLVLSCLTLVEAVVIGLITQYFKAPVPGVTFGLGRGEEKIARLEYRPEAGNVNSGSSQPAGFGAPGFASKESDGRTADQPDLDSDAEGEGHGILADDDELSRARFDASRPVADEPEDMRIGEMSAVGEPGEEPMEFVEELLDPPPVTAAAGASTSLVSVRDRFVVPPVAGEAELEEVDGDADEDAGIAEEAGTVVQPRHANAPRELAARKAKRRAYSVYHIPDGTVSKDYGADEYWKIDAATRKLAEVLKATLEEFNIKAEVTGIQKGPVITMFEILPAPGVKLSKIVNLADNIALRLAASRVRIVAPIPGKQAVGIEVPNARRAIVSLRELVNAEAFKTSTAEIPVALGKDITGHAEIVDLVSMPHMLIAGATGSGKSVCVNSLICSILFSRSPDQVRLMLIDPKIVELKYFNDIPHLLTPVITEPKKAFQALQWCICEMERRYAMLDSLCVRDIRAYNRKVKKKGFAQEPLPYIVVIIDEFADLMATTGKELESTLARLAAMSRAVGIHLVLATQRPSIDVITGLIKANIPSRIAFMVASKFDSRIIIDAVGAEKLLGQGDMLFSSSWNPFPVRMQGAYVAEDEVEDLVDYVKTLGEPDYIDDEIFVGDEDMDPMLFEGGADPLYNQALDIVLTSGKASTSYIQRRLKVGYNRAARLVEEMEQRGIVGPAQGSRPREIIHVPSRAGSTEA